MELISQSHSHSHLAFKVVCMFLLGERSGLLYLCVSRIELSLSRPLR